MSDVTHALLQNLKKDLVPLHLDDYQFGLAVGGGLLWPDATLVQAQAFYQVQSLLKKYHGGLEPSKSACNAAMEKFMEANTRATNWALRIMDEREAELLGLFRDQLYRFFYVDAETPLIGDFCQVVSRGGLGKGMNRKARAPDLYTKLFDSSISCTRHDLLDVWSRTVSRDPRWGMANANNSVNYSPVLVKGNSLSFVPKNVSVARCISTEPTINMWMQKGVGALIEDRLRRFFNIDLSSQPEVNRALARVGSMRDHLVTVDLESASDSISVGMLQLCLPKDFLRWLMLLRSPVCSTPQGDVELGMVSTMGNGFTFPLQTLIFASVVTAVYRFRGIPLVKDGVPEKRNFGIFGDDIICSKEAYSDVSRLLEILGFRQNYGKTFVDGPFRESCGGDYFRGHPVRGVYIKTLAHLQGRYSAVNTLNRWSSLTGIRLRQTVMSILAPIRRVFYVPNDESDEAGVHVPLTMAHSPKSVYPGTYQYSFSQATAPSVKFFHKDKQTPEVDGLTITRGARSRNYNPEGAWLCFLFGAIRGYKITIKQDVVKYRTNTKVTPNWDSLSTRYRSLGVGWQHWVSAVRYNIT